MCIYSWKIICLRVIANLMVLFLLCVSALAVIWVVKRSEEKNDSWWRRNEITVVMSLISFLFPMLFEILGLMEYYHPRMQLRLQLARIMILNLLNLYSLIWALFGKIRGMTERLGQIRNYQEMNTTTTNAPIWTPTTASQLPSSTVQSITESVFAKITEIINYTTTDYPTEPTEVYDYGNTNYFEPDYEETKSTTIETSTAEPFFNVTEPFMNFTEIYDDLTTFFLDDMDYDNVTGDLLENSNFNMSNLLPVMNLSSVFNATNVEPIAAALQYNMLQQEPSSFINMDLLNSSTKLELRKLCWETMFGQELVKLTVMDLVSQKIFFR